ncbi:MAG: YbaB/EbfC family nucleoid-associated protein [Coriobacteriales bacterium]|jgi:DNA-binding YbaB/EbfC family protein|nr:YbaB/EbfC family nucleoid-associated protein [Coriobacteriales bacterium]
MTISMDMNKMMKEARKMQAELARVQEEVAQMECIGSAGGGAITAVVGGDQSLKSIKISPAVIDPDDVEMLEDLVVAAVNDAMAAATALAQEKMGAVTGGLNLPGF